MNMGGEPAQLTVRREQALVIEALQYDILRLWRVSLRPRVWSHEQPPPADDVPPSGRGLSRAADASRPRTWRATGGFALPAGPIPRDLRNQGAGTCCLKVIQEYDAGAEVSLSIEVESGAGIPEDVLKKRIIEGLEMLGIQVREVTE